MKSNYSRPEVKVFTVMPAKCVLASGENLLLRNYGDDPNEDSNCFWE